MRSMLNTSRVNNYVTGLTETTFVRSTWLVATTLSNYVELWNAGLLE